MLKKLFIIAVLMAIGLSACRGRASLESITSTPTEARIAAPPTTEVSAATAMPQAPPIEATVTDNSGTVLPIATPTAELPRPTNPPDCTNGASFVADVTIPDSSAMVGGTTFTKTWRVRNTGSCVWGPDYTLTTYSEEKLSAPPSVPLGVTFPGQTLDISVDLTAPNTVGTHRGNFVIENPKGLIMRIDGDSRLWVIIKVTTTVAATVPPAGAANSAPVPPVGAANTAPPATGTGLGASSSTISACDSTTEPANLTATINAVNAYRAQNGLADYTVNELLSSAAQAHANDMACNQLFVHTGSDGSTPQTRVAATGYTASSVTENVYGSYPPLTGQEAVNWWINDKTDLNHNRNLLSKTYTEIGVGYAFFDNYGFYVLVFAKP